MLKNLLLLIFLLSFVSIGYAQPTGTEVYDVLAEAQKIEKVINELSNEIAESPNNPDLYSKRGFLRLEILEIVHGGKYYLPQGTHPLLKLLEPYSVENLKNSGVKDFSKAINIKPKAEYYAGRGKFYSSHWYEYKQRKGWFDDKQKLIPDTQKEQILLTDKKIELILLERFVKDEDFISAESDLIKSLKINDKSEYANHVRQELVKLYIARSGQIISNVKRDKRIIVENEFGYSIEDDLIKAFKFVNEIPKSEYKTESKYAYGFPKLRDYHNFETELFNSLDVFLNLATYAEAYSKYDQVSDKLTAPTNYFETFIRDYQKCWFYYFRSKALNELGKYEQALETIDRTDLSSPNSKGCSEAYFSKGDALLGMNRPQEAINSYTKLFEDQNDISQGLRIKAYKNRALAYLKLENYEKALEDFTNAYNSSSDILYTYQRFDLKKEYAKLKLQIYKNLNKQDKILETEYQIKENEFYKNKYNTERTVFGTVVDKEGNPIRDTYVFERIVFTNPVYYWEHSEKRRMIGYSGSPISYDFFYKHLPDESFRIHAFIEREINGETYRLFGRTEILKVEGKVLGPIILKLDKMAKIKSGEDLP